MYEYPYGGMQQLNLNWVVNQIIDLHEKLDPDWEAPKLAQIYPYTNTQQVNLDWILSELKQLKAIADSLPNDGEDGGDDEPVTPGADLQTVGAMLLAGEYDTTKEYQKNDYITREDRILRAKNAATGVFSANDWQEVKLGDDLSIITRWASAMDAFINAIGTDNVTNESSVEGMSASDALNALLTRYNGLSDGLAGVNTTLNAVNESLAGKADNESINAINNEITNLGNLLESANVHFPNVVITSVDDYDGVISSLGDDEMAIAPTVTDFIEPLGVIGDRIGLMVIRNCASLSLSQYFIATSRLIASGTKSYNSAPTTSRNSVPNTAWTPNFMYSAGTTAPTMTNVTGTYYVTMGTLHAWGRFTLSAANTTLTSMSLEFTLPDNYSLVSTRTGALGWCQGSDNTMFNIRSSSSTRLRFVAGNATTSSMSSMAEGNVYYFEFRCLVQYRQPTDATTAIHENDKIALDNGEENFSENDKITLDNGEEM